MRTNIEIDDELMARAMEATGLPTKRATVEAALRALVQNHAARADRLIAQRALLDLWGTVPDWNDGRFDEGEDPGAW